MDTNLVKNLIRVGCVSAVNPSNCSARVVFDDKDYSGNPLVSDELPIVIPCSVDNKAYWLPDINTEVLCIMLPNVSGNGLNEGFVLGAVYNETDQPKENAAGVKSIRFSDGSYLRYADGNIEIHASGNITITANGNITIKGATLNLNP